MIYQTDKRLPKKYGDDECFFFIFLNIIEKVAKVKLTVKQIIKIHKQSSKYGFIGQKGASDGDAYVNERGAQGIGMVASAIIGAFVDIRMVGESDYYNYLAAKFVRRVPNASDVIHFVEVDRYAILKPIYDPWDKNGSRTAREGYIDSYRYIYARLL